MTPVANHPLHSLPFWRRGRALLARWGPFLVPPLYLALIFWLEPADHLGETPDKAPWLFRTVYDDWDLTAMALRGLNASLGRTAGRADNPHEIADDVFNRLLDKPPSLQQRYYLEYPHPTLLLFRFPYWLFPLTEAPPAVCDGGYGNIVAHVPRNDSERQLWRHFRRVIQTYQVLMCCGVLLLMAMVRVGYEPDGALSGPVILLILPAALYFSLNRFDVLPALLTALGLACLGRRRYVVCGLLFGLATAIKIYPVLLVPLVFHYLWPHRRVACCWLAAYAVGLVTCFLPPLVLSGAEAVWQPFQLQLTRLPMGLTIYGYLLPRALEENDLLGRLFRLGTVVVVMGFLTWRRPSDLTSLLRRGAIAVIVFISLQVFYSPQWIVWLLPLLIPLASRQRHLIGLIVALDLITFFNFPLANYHLPGAVAVYPRFAILAALVGVLTWAELRRPALAHAAAVV